MKNHNTQHLLTFLEYAPIKQNLWSRLVQIKLISYLFTIKYELSNTLSHVCLEKCQEAENLRITDAVWDKFYKFERIFLML